jgi:NhaC family Na+:H+ antiporter
MQVGMLKALIKGAEKFVVNAASLVICSILTCITTVMISASEYLSIVMPGEALKLLYKKRGISRKVLSRSLEDGGTIFSTLVPWSANAVFVASTLSVATMEYLPYAFFSFLCPIISILYALVGIAVWDDKDDEDLELS